MNSEPEIIIVQELEPLPPVEEKPYNDAAKTTVPELPFLQLLIESEVIYSQNLALTLSQVSAEERATLHRVFIKAATNRNRQV
jgi:hypothetical protein